MSALGLLDVPNGWLLATAISSLIILGVVFLRMRRNDLAGSALSPSQHGAVGERALAA